ncbi:sumo domain-containing protein ASCRUDRAFT_76364, partial [Ascoidea rubescens DSM 1968]
KNEKHDLKDQRKDEKGKEQVISKPEVLKQVKQKRKQKQKSQNKKKIQEIGKNNDSVEKDIEMKDQLEIETTVGIDNNRNSNGDNNFNNNTEKKIDHNAINNTDQKVDQKVDKNAENSKDQQSNESKSEIQNQSTNSESKKKKETQKIVKPKKIAKISNQIANKSMSEDSKITNKADQKIKSKENGDEHNEDTTMGNVDFDKSGVAEPTKYCKVEVVEQSTKDVYVFKLKTSAKLKYLFKTFSRLAEVNVGDLEFYYDNQIIKMNDTPALLKMPENSSILCKEIEP